jgi:sulfite exporter TauE/SafE/plastocyanin domain-containing protein/copper chaperone CopZ
VIFIKVVVEIIHIKQMHCLTCESRIENALKKVPGVLCVKASYADNIVNIEYDPHCCSLATLNEVITSAGYLVDNSTPSFSKVKPIVGVLIIFLAILLLGQTSGEFDMNERLNGEVTYVVLFVIGLFTSLHCVGMCGGIMLSQSMTTQTTGKVESFLPSLSYNTGRVLGYTTLGGIVGALGSVLSLSIGFMAGIAILAGIFMILMGLNLAGFTLFRNYLRIPIPIFSLLPKAKTPFVIGLLNGLMPCGPLQTMQIYALGTGSAILGASSMLVFSLGTVPLMLSFGTITGFLSKNSTKRILKLSGVLVIVLGMIMTNRGLALAGLNLPFADLTSNSKNGAFMPIKAEVADGIQTLRITANNRGYVPNVLYVQKNIPLRWIIDGEQINSCNNQIIIPSLNIKKKLVSGENVINILPQDQDLSFSCWMGMINGVIKVVDDVNAVNVSKDKTTIPSGSGCCSTNGTSSCCNSQPQSSIYGDDISKVPTERILQKATLENQQQAVKLKGIGYEFEPLVAVIAKQIRTTITFDLTEFDNPEGNWEIVDYRQKKIISTFQGQKGFVEVNFQAESSGTFGIYKDRKVTGVIEVVDDLETINLETLRAKFL